MVTKLSEHIDNLKCNLEFLGKNRMEKWSPEYNAFSNLIWELTVVHGICCFAEKFLLQDLLLESEENEVESMQDLLSESKENEVESKQDLPSESEENEVEQTLEAFYIGLFYAIRGNVLEIYAVCDEIRKGLELDRTRSVAVFSSFHEAVKTLNPLCGKVLDKYMHSSESKHCTMDELLDFMQLFLKDGAECYTRSGLDWRQLRQLNFLKDFIIFAASQGVGQEKLQDLLAHTQVVVIPAAFCSYMFDHRDTASWSSIFSQCSEMLKVQPVMIKEASRSLCSSDHARVHDDDDVLGAFIKFLQDKGETELDYVLFHGQTTAIADVKILIKQLQHLRNFLKDHTPKGVDLGEEIANLICEVVTEATMLFYYSLSLYDLKEDTKLDLANLVKKVKFLEKYAVRQYLKMSRYEFPRTDEFGSVLMAPKLSYSTRKLPDSTRKLSDSTQKLSDLIDILTSYKAYLMGFREIGYELDGNKFELTRVRRICYCLDMFSLQDLTSESDDQNSEYSFDSLVHAINEKTWEVYSVIHEIRKVNMSFKEHSTICSSSFHHVLEILKSFLFGNALDNYMHLAQSKHCTMEELLDLIRLISEDGKSSRRYLPLHKLDFLKNLISFAASRGVGQDKLQDLLAHIKVIITAATYRLYIFYEPKVLDSTRKSLISSRYSEMLKVHESEVRVLKALGSSCSSDYTKMDDNIVEAFIDSLLRSHWELLSSKSSFTVSSMKILIEELRFLRNFLIHKRQEGRDLDEEMTHLIFDVVIQAGIVSNSISLDDEKEVPSRDSKIGLLNWMEKVQLLKEDVMQKFPETLRYKFPRTNELGFMDGLLEDLKELIRYKPDSIAFAQGQLDIILEDLAFLRDFLQDTMKQQNENEKLKALPFRVVDVAYRFEFVINSLMVGDPSLDCSPTSFNTIKEEIKKIRAEIKEINMGKRFQIEALNPPKISNGLPSTRSNPKIDDVIVGFEDEAEKIIARLEANSLELDIVSIVGMPGRGKTTLAKKVYHDIRSRFLICAWCCVSQGYQTRELLFYILNDIFGDLPTGVGKMSVEDLEKYLYQSLKGRRYLIVLDDIWDIEAWRGLQSSFPNDHNQSRILLTSRMHNVALEIKSDSKPHFLRQLNDDESMELLEKRLFHQKGYPVELQNLGMKFAKSCKGLPLAVVTVAGILATLEEDSWKDFAKGLSTALVSGSEECTELFELSYTHLPDYLKPCLLYFGSFLQDQEIPISRLIWLWMAEGFVQKSTDEKSLENVGEDYLKDLINRSLVMVVKRTSRDGIKTCSVHDLVHQFCVTRAKEENFLQVLNQWKKIGPLSEPRRMCLYSSKGVPCFRHVSSLKLFPSGHYSEFLSILCGFKILKVLDLRGIDCSLFPAEIEMLVHLRFLALGGIITSIPPTIVKLLNLETLLLSGLRGGISLPYTLLNMTKLRHMHMNTPVRMNTPVVFSLKEQNLEKCCRSSNLETFSTLLLSSEHDVVMIIRQIPYLRKLKCTFLGSWDPKFVYQFPALNFLSQLESLKVYSLYRVKYKLEFSFPLNLKKLTLSHFYLPWASISIFAELPNLEVLKLVNKGCEGETWDMEEEVFTKLKYLKFENLDIVHWNACSDNFPCLRQLILHKCKKLQEFPNSIEEFNCLEIVEVKHCNRSIETSARTLKEQVEDLRVFIYPSPIEEVDSIW